MNKFRLKNTLVKNISWCDSSIRLLLLILAPSMTNRLENFLFSLYTIIAKENTPYGDFILVVAGRSDFFIFTRQHLFKSGPLFCRIELVACTPAPP